MSFLTHTTLARVVEGRRSRGRSPSRNDLSPPRRAEAALSRTVLDPMYQAKRINSITGMKISVLSIMMYVLVSPIMAETPNGIAYKVRLENGATQ